MKAVLFILLIAGGSYFYLQQTSTDIIKLDSSQIPKSVLDLKKDINTREITKADVRILGDAFYKSETDNSREVMIRLMTYALLATSPAAYPNLKVKINNDYPTKGYLNFVEKEFARVCNTCNGKGKTTCLKCKGTAKCPNQKCTEGRLKYIGLNGQKTDKPCPVCRGKDQCSTCRGSGLSHIPCKTCEGSGFEDTKATAIIRYRDAIKNL